MDARGQVLEKEAARSSPDGPVGAGRERRRIAKPTPGKPPEDPTRAREDDPEETAPPLPAKWPWLAAVHLLAATICGVMGQSFPTITALVAFLSAALLFSLSRKVGRMGSARPVWVTPLFGVVPHLLIGFGFADWMYNGQLPFGLGKFKHEAAVGAQEVAEDKTGHKRRDKPVAADQFSA